VTLFAVVHGSMAGPAAYTRLAEELDCRGHRTLLVELPGGHCPHVSRPAVLADVLTATTAR
jgi:hypothetical protein